MRIQAKQLWQKEELPFSSEVAQQRDSKVYMMVKLLIVAVLSYVIIFM